MNSDRHSESIIHPYVHTPHTHTHICIYFGYWTAHFSLLSFSVQSNIQFEWKNVSNFLSTIFSKYLVFCGLIFNWIFCIRKYFELTATNSADSTFNKTIPFIGHQLFGMWCLSVTEPNRGVRWNYNFPCLKFKMNSVGKMLEIVVEYVCHRKNFKNVNHFIANSNRIPEFRSAMNS